MWVGSWVVEKMEAENQLRPVEAWMQRRVSRATTSSSLAGMTKTFTREFAAEISPSLRQAAFFAGSSTRPSWSRSAQMAARREGLSTRLNS